MRIKQSNNYGWERPEIMHKYSLMWCSRLKFIANEHKFLNNMLKDKIFSFAESHLIPKGEKLMEQLDELQKEAEMLVHKIELHRNGLRILFDGIDNQEDWNYKHEHRKLLIKMHEFDSKNNFLKKEIFRTITEALKHHKQKRLLN